jgi:hypothetical protein
MKKLELLDRYGRKIIAYLKGEELTLNNTVFYINSDDIKRIEKEKYINLIGEKYYITNITYIKETKDEGKK